jgi:hypothetical protein
MNCRLLFIISFLLALSCDKGNPVDENQHNFGSMTDIEGTCYECTETAYQKRDSIGIPCKKCTHKAN